MFLLNNNADPDQNPINSYNLKEVNRQIANLEEEYKKPFEMH
jgi:hypothetical protein